MVPKKHWVCSRVAIFMKEILPRKNARYVKHPNVLFMDVMKYHLRLLLKRLKQVR